jgi:adenylate kinase family enzyme
VVDPWAAAPLVSVKTSAKKPKIVWSVGGPGSGQDILVEAIGQALGLDVIHVPTLLAAAMEQRTECGRVLLRHRGLGRPAPSHIVVTLIQQAIAQSQPSKTAAASAAAAASASSAGAAAAATVPAGVRAPRGVILAQFPLSLDDAFAFEKAFDAPASVLAFECSEDAALTRLVQAQTTPVARDKLVASVKAFAEQAQPVIEHYRAFDKVLALSTEDTLVQPADLVKAQLAPRVAAVLTVVAPKERAPKRPPKMPRKKVVVQPEEVF